MTGPSAYARHEVLVAPARAYPQFWRLLVGLVLASVAHYMLSQIYFGLIDTLRGPQGPSLSQSLEEGGSPSAIYLLLLSFAFLAVGVGLSAQVLHKRSFMTLLGPLPMLVQSFRAVTTALLLLIGVVFLLPPWDMGADLVPNLQVSRWILLLLPSLVVVLIQVGAEEVVFRGYIQQQLAARFRSPLFWMVLPSVFFALGHYLPQSAGENAVAIAVWAGVFGILMADLTARSGSLGPAIAVHFVNNVSAILIVSLPDQLSGLALYHSPFSMQDTEALRAWMPADFAMMIVMWLAARLAIRR